MVPHPGATIPPLTITLTLSLTLTLTLTLTFCLTEWCHTQVRATKILVEQQLSL